MPTASLAALTLLAAFAGIVPAVGDATPRSAAAIAAQALAARVPEMPLTLADGRRTSLAELGREGPLLLTFFYRRCPLVCRPYLRELRSALERRRSSGPAPRVVAVSFDPEDGIEEIAAEAAAIGVASDPAWSLAISEPAALDRALPALGYWYQRDPQTGRFDHVSMVIGLAEGRVRGVFVGNDVNGPRFAVLLRDLAGERVAFEPLPGPVAFRCFRFEPGSGSVTLDWGFLLLVVPGTSAIVVTLILFGRRRRDNPRGVAETLDPIR